VHFPFVEVFINLILITLQISAKSNTLVMTHVKLNNDYNHPLFTGQAIYNGEIKQY